MADTDQQKAPLVENKQQSEDHLEIDIPEEDFEPGPECCIYKVPIRLREVRQTAYTPRSISIGPIHHGNENLAKMERQKLRYLKKFCERTSKTTLEEFLSFIKENVRRIYGCYDEFVFEAEFKASKFITMVLKDAVFIIELLLRCYWKEDDFLLNRKWLSIELRIDLILLENQLPFFVLEDLYNLAFGSSDRPSFLHIACDYLEISETMGDLPKETEIKHFTDLARCLVVGNHLANSDETVNNVYNATMLREAGVDFKALQGAKSLLDVRYEKGELRIPAFYMGQGSEALIRNMMALEQCHYAGKAYVCSYIQLLDYLVDTDKDADLLVKKGIFPKWTGSSAALADMINSLMVGVARGYLPDCYDKIGKDLNRYYDNSWNQTIATLRHVYFKNLWRGTATVAAFFVVLLTLTQTELAILDRAKPSK